MNQLFELKRNVCEALQSIVEKGADLSKQDVETAYHAVKLMDIIERMSEREEEYSGRRGANGRYYDEGRENSRMRSRDTDMGRSGHMKIIDHLSRMMDEASSDYERAKIKEWMKEIR